MLHYVPYWVFIDAIGTATGGPVVDVESLRPGRSPLSLAEEDRVVRAATALLPTCPFVPEERYGRTYRDAVALPVLCSGPGFAYSDLRHAANLYRSLHGHGCYRDLGPMDWLPPLCGAPTQAYGLCRKHRSSR